MKRSIPQLITVAILMMMVYPALVDQRHQARAQPGSNRELTRSRSIFPTVSVGMQPSFAALGQSK